MDHDVDRRQISAPGEAAEDLTDPSLDAVAHDSLPDLAAGGDAETRRALFVGVEVESRQGAAPLASPPVAALEVSSLPQSMVAGQPLARRRCGPGHAGPGHFRR